MSESSPDPGAAYTRFVGIDVASRTCTVVEKGAVAPPSMSYTVAQTADGLANFVARLGAHPDPPARTLIALEATGTYSIKLATALREAGYAVAILNPRHARSYAHYRRARSKTDHTDATTLATQAEEDQLPLWEPPRHAVGAVRLLMRHRDRLGATIVQERNRLHALDQLPAGAEAVRAHIEAHIAFLRTQQLSLLIAARAASRADPVFRAATKRVLTIPGLGEIVTLTLLAEMDLFAQCATTDQAVAFAGLDPRLRESGSSKAQPHISKVGSPHVRRVLFQAALIAIRHEATFKPYYSRLLAAEKPKKVALVAVSRRLLVIAWALVRYERDFDSEWEAKRYLTKPMVETP